MRRRSASVREVWSRRAASRVTARRERPARDQRIRAARRADRHGSGRAGARPSRALTRAGGRASRAEIELVRILFFIILAALGITVALPLLLELAAAPFH